MTMLFTAALFPMSMGNAKETSVDVEFCGIFETRAHDVNQRAVQSQIVEFESVIASVDCEEKMYVVNWQIRSSFLDELGPITKSMHDRLLGITCAPDAGWEVAFSYGWTSKYILIDQDGEAVSSIVVNDC